MLVDRGDEEVDLEEEMVGSKVKGVCGSTT